MKIQFLGTSAGIPTRCRNVSSIVYAPDVNGDWFLVDCGEGAQLQLLKTSWSIGSLRAIFITHLHGDHCFGLPGLLATLSTLGRREPLTLCGPQGLSELLEHLFKLTQTNLCYELKIIESSHRAEVFEAGESLVTALALSHRVPCFAYKFTTKPTKPRLNQKKLVEDKIPRGPLWNRIQRESLVRLDNGHMLDSSIYRVASEVRNIIIAGDNDTPLLLEPYVTDVDVLIHEATYTEAVSQKVGPRPQHSSARSIAQFADTAKIPNLILTHFSARYSQANSGKTDSMSDLKLEAEQNYRGVLALANDLDIFELSQNGQLKRVPI